MGRPIVPESVVLDRLKSDSHTFVKWHTGKYTGVFSKAVMNCSNGHTFVMAVNNLYAGSSCSICAGNKRVSETVRIHQLNALDNLTFVKRDDGYSNNTSKAVMRCNNGHEFTAAVNHLIIHRTQCPTCQRLKRNIEQRLEESEVVRRIEDAGYRFVTWVGEYVDARSVSRVECQCGHQRDVPASYILYQDAGCPACAKTGYDVTKIGTLYALRSTDGLMVKIGISNDYARRHITLARKTPFEWECIALIHGDGEMIACLEKMFHNMTDRASFETQFDGYTEWRVWKPVINEWLDNWRDILM